MSQTDRVLAALRRGPVTPIDFLAPTIDGGPPILRLAARIQDLRDRGHHITTRTGTVAAYTLAHDPPKPAPAPESGGLFDGSVFRQATAHYDEEAA